MAGYVNEYFNNDQADLFIQPDGPGTDAAKVPCNDLGDTSQALGDVARERCADPNHRGRWITAMRSKGPKDEATFDLTVRIGKTSNALEDVVERSECPLAFYKLFRMCGGRTTFLPFDRADIFPAAVLISQGDSNTSIEMSVDGAPTGASETFSVSAEDWLRVFSLVAERRTTTQASILNDIAFYDAERCGGVCGAAEYPGTHAMIPCDAIGAAVPNILYSADKGLTWAICAASPTATVSINMVSVVAVYYNGNRRWIVTRGTEAGVALMVYWSEDDGTTWNIVTVGSTLTEFAVGSESLFALDAAHVWVVTDTGAGAAGNVYFSADAGATWTLQTTAGDSLNAVKFANEKVGLAAGAANTILLTVDGGEVWSTVTGPAAQAAADVTSLAIFNEYNFMLGYDDGELWQTFNGGTTWTQRTLATPAGLVSFDSINAITAVNDHVIFLTYAWTAAVNTYLGVQRSIAGGEEGTWEHWDAPVEDDATTGGKGIDAVGMNFAMAVGGIATTGMILEVSQS